MLRLGRNIRDVILLDNSPISYLFQPENGMPIKNWYDDKSDTELSCYIPILEKLAYVNDVRHYLDDMRGTMNNIDFGKARNVLANAEYMKAGNSMDERKSEETESMPSESPGS